MLFGQIQLEARRQGHLIHAVQNSQVSQNTEQGRGGQEG